MLELLKELWENANEGLEETGQLVFMSNLMSCLIFGLLAYLFTSHDIYEIILFTVVGMMLFCGVYHLAVIVSYVVKSIIGVFED